MLSCRCYIASLNIRISSLAAIFLCQFCLYFIKVQGIKNMSNLTIRSYSNDFENGNSNTWNAFKTLLISAGIALFILYLKFHWKRRRLYYIARQVNQGPFCWPFIGCGYKFIGNPYVIFGTITKILNDYRYICNAWFGSDLFYAITKPEYLEIVLNSPKAYTKADIYRYTENIVGTGLFSAGGSKWKRNRKLLMPTFNQRILNQFVEVFSEQSMILVEQLKSICGKQNTDIFDVIIKSTLDIICETAMGIKINAVTTNSAFGKWADRVMEITFLRIFVIWYHPDFIFKLTSLHKEFKEIVKNMHNFIDKIVREKRLAYENKLIELPESQHEESIVTRKAFLDLLIELSSQGANFSDEELRDETLTFTIAGSDTTATANCFTLIMLGMHKDIQQKVYEEVLDVLGPDRQLTYEDLPNLKYTERVIKETLRLFPAAAFVARAIHEDIPLDEKITLPAGSSALLGILSVHRNEEYWPNPLKFDPDRFLPEECAKRHPYTYLPFSGGPRNCIGMKYAMMAMKSVVAAVVRKYKISTPYKSVKDIKLKLNLILRAKNGFLVNFEPRNNY